MTGLGRTKLVQVDSAQAALHAIEEGAGVIRRGGLVAFPTETVYGLGANALDPVAVRAIYAAKERAADDPLIVHIASAAELEAVALELPAVARRLADAFWPGPLTMVLKRAPAVAANVAAGLGTVAVRVPRHAVALALIRAAGCPIAAPSANRFMHTSPTTARHVLEDLDGRIDLVLDGGPCEIGVESTVVDLTGSPPALLRPGGLAPTAIEAVLGMELTRTSRKSSPGMLERHYAPRARLVYVAPGAGTEQRIQAAQASAGPDQAGLLLPSELLPAARAAYPEAPFVDLGPGGSPAEAARRLFAGMRALDAQGCTTIVAAGPETHGLGEAVHDRLRRAAAEIR